MNNPVFSLSYINFPKGQDSAAQGGTTRSKPVPEGSMNLMLTGRDQYRLAGPRWLREEEGVWALDPLDQADGKLFSQTTVEVRHPGCTVETEGHGPTMAPPATLPPTQTHRAPLLSSTTLVHHRSPGR